MRHWRDEAGSDLRDGPRRKLFLSRGNRVPQDRTLPPRADVALHDRTTFVFITESQTTVTGIVFFCRPATFHPPVQARRITPLYAKHRRTWTPNTTLCHDFSQNSPPLGSPFPGPSLHSARPVLPFYVYFHRLLAGAALGLHRRPLPRSDILLRTPSCGGLADSKTRAVSQSKGERVNGDGKQCR